MRLLALADDQRFHPDEALFADLSRRVGIWGDWQLLNTPTDKPPFFHFVGGSFYALLGDSEFATRLPNAFASLIILALVFTLARHLTQNLTVATFAMLLVTLSPMDIAFSISGFADTQLSLWLLATALLLIQQRWGWAGLSFGLALATKQTALWFTPLLLALMLLAHADWRGFWHVARSLAIVVFFVFLWDASRAPFSFWEQSISNYSPGRLIRSDEVWPRLEAFLQNAQYLVPLPSLIGLVAVVIHLIRHQRTRQDLIWWAVTGFSLAYIGAHWLIAFNIRDRYLLLLVPWLALLIAVAGARLIKRFPQLVMVVAVVSLPFAGMAATRQLPLATDDGQHTGIDALAATMNRDFAGEIFYEHWLGWELRYYLTADPQVFLLWFPTPEDLADYAQEELPTIPVPRYFVAPKSEATPWLSLFAQRGLQQETVYDDGRYVIVALSM